MIFTEVVNPNEVVGVSTLKTMYDNNSIEIRTADGSYRLQVAEILELIAFAGDLDIRFGVVQKKKYRYLRLLLPE